MAPGRCDAEEVGTGVLCCGRRPMGGEGIGGLVMGRRMGMGEMMMSRSSAEAAALGMRVREGAGVAGDLCFALFWGILW